MNEHRRANAAHGLRLAWILAIAGCGGAAQAPSASAPPPSPMQTATAGAPSTAQATTSTPPAAGSGGAKPAGALPTVTTPSMPAATTTTAGSTSPSAMPTSSGAAGSMSAANGGSAAPSSSAGAMAKPAQMGGFPKDEAVNTDQKGPYMFDKYTEGLDNPTYASSVMYYPKDATPPYPAVAFSPGFTATKENYEMFLGPLLASHGIAILLTTPTTTGDFPPQRAEDLQAALKQIEKENTREGSPLKGKLATDRLGVTGHSMGGGGTCIAANTLGDKIKCAVPLQPWEPGSSFPMIKAPTMFIAAQSDTIAGVDANAKVFYASIPMGVPKFYVEFAGASHFLTTNDLGTAYDAQSKYMIAFYKRYLEDDKRYDEVLNAAMDKALSAYEHK